nr:hypothetical protein [Nocardia otitidiscaviarum]
MALPPTLTEGRSEMVTEAFGPMEAEEPVCRPEETSVLQPSCNPERRTPDLTPLLPSPVMLPMAVASTNASRVHGDWARLGTVLTTTFTSDASAIQPSTVSLVTTWSGLRTSSADADPEPIEQISSKPVEAARTFIFITASTSEISIHITLLTPRAKRIRHHMGNCSVTFMGWITLVASGFVPSSLVIELRDRLVSEGFRWVETRSIGRVRFDSIMDSPAVPE